MSKLLKSLSNLGKTAVNKATFGYGFKQYAERKNLRTIDPFSNTFDKGIISKNTLLSGFQTLFTTFVQGTVFDPSHAIRKNPQILTVMKRDSHVYATTRTRYRSVAGLDWSLIPASEEGEKNKSLHEKIAKETEKIIRKIPKLRESFVNIKQDIMDGVSINEMVLDIDDRTLQAVINQIVPVHKDHITFDVNGNIKMLNKHNPVFGVPVPQEKFIISTFDMSAGSYHEPQEFGKIFWGEGLADVLYYLIFFKTNVLTFWVRYLEIVAKKIKKGTYPPTDSNMKDLVLEALKSIEEDSCVAWPDDGSGQYKLEFIDAMGTRSLDPFFNFISNFVNPEISKVVLGQTLTTEQGDKGAFALGKVHNDIRLEIVQFDKESLEEVLTKQVVELLVKYNYPGVRDFPKFQFKLEVKQDLMPQLLEFEKGQQIGLELGEKFVLESLGWPKAEPKEKILQRLESGLPGMNQQMLEQLQSQRDQEEFAA